MKLTRSQRSELREMFGGRCAYCGAELGLRWCADHVRPIHRRSKPVRAADGTYRFVATGKSRRPKHDTIGNLLPACSPCNVHKGPLSLEAWRQVLADSLGILARNYSTYRAAKRFGMLTETAPTPIVFYFERADAAATDGGE